jgi:hypothetical protein
VLARQLAFLVGRDVLRKALTIDGVGCTVDATSSRSMPQREYDDAYDAVLASP